MQIVEYLYATVFGNDLHPRFEFLSAVSYPRTGGIPPIRRTEENLSTVYFLHLSLEWKSIHSDTCFAGIYFDPLFTFSPLDLPRLMHPRIFFSPVYRIYRDVLAIKSKRRILAKYSNRLFFNFVENGGNKKKRRNFRGDLTAATVALSHVHGAKGRVQRR